MKFYLGTHMPSWLKRPDVPLFVSHRRLRDRKKLPTAACDWALDSGGFTELSMYGEWRTTPDEYIDATRRYVSEVGRLEWAAPQDWMCEPWIVAKTGLTVDEHQRRTVDNFCHLTTIAPDLPFVPVVQGWRIGDYLKHVDLYADAGIDLRDWHTVGVGSVCRRQATSEIAQVIVELSNAGLALHGFGVKGAGIRSYGWLLKSADSMAWSFTGRDRRPCPHGSGAVSCANCWPYALEWRQDALNATAQPVQLRMVA